MSRQNISGIVTMHQAPVRLSFQTNSLSFELEDGRTVYSQISVPLLVDKVLKHDPSTPLEIERAIERIEIALMGMGTKFNESTKLITDEPIVRSLMDLTVSESSLERDAVENLFQQLSVRSRGIPVTAKFLPPGRDMAAVILILRECMHHLGFTSVKLATE